LEISDKNIKEMIKKLLRFYPE